jgi:hypothetical protein
MELLKELHPCPTFLCQSIEHGRLASEANPTASCSQIAPFRIEKAAASLAKTTAKPGYKNMENQRHYRE